MADFYDNPMLKMMDKYSDFGDGTWDAFKQDFVKQAPLERIQNLKVVDGWLEQEGDRPTRQVASMMQAKRELDDIHWRLRELGK